MWWGVAAALLANVLYSTGFVLEKRALTAMPSVSVREPARLLRLVLGSPLWIGGSIALASGFGAQLIVYRTLPIAAAQGIFVSGLVILVLLSSKLLGEETSGRERYALGAILAALLMVVLSLNERSDTVSRSAPVSTILLVCLPTLATGVWLYGSAEHRARRRHRMPTTGVEYGVAVGLLYGVSSLAIKGVSSYLTTDGLGGAVLDLLVSPYPYILMFTGAFGLIMSQAALQRSRASLIVPVCTTVTCLFTAGLGTLAFGEALPEDPVRLALRLGGTALAVSVLLAMPKHDPPAKPEPRPSDPTPPSEPEPEPPPVSAWFSKSSGWPTEPESRSETEPPPDHEDHEPTSESERPSQSEQPPDPESLSEPDQTTDPESPSEPDQTTDPESPSEPDQTPDPESPSEPERPSESEPVPESEPASKPERPTPTRELTPP
ncbi:hypothetical protein GCM10010094_43910 [Streptomyces flaveus]|uniref:Magnesium transporter NIPA n=1 Tax=Streptomyces flaveus TaxID=66370 RepID=A0A917QZN3_9ACTN|nr:hypothetical protein GCM10010094_43910 [Streptomyces flaveus]